MSPDRLRVLLTTDVVGGVWDFCMLLAAGLREAGDEVTLLTLGVPSLMQRSAARRCGVDLVERALKLEWMQDCETDVQATQLAVAEVAHSMRADVVHANQFAAACADLDVPLVLTVHSDVLSWRRWTLGCTDIPTEWRSYYALVREATRRADRVIAVSHFLAEQMRSFYDLKTPIDVVYNGWPAPESGALERERTSVLAGRAWDAAKNITLAIDAAQGWDPGQVYLAGDLVHPESGHSASIGDPLRPLGILDRGQMDELLGRAAVYISPARYDPFGLLPLQAALHGCSLLLSDIPSYRELWDGAACFFQPDDADDLRRKWQSLLDARPRPAAREYAKTRYSPEQMTHTYRRHYTTIRQRAAA